MLIEAGDKLEESPRKDAFSDILRGDDHHDFLSVQGQRRRDLRTDKATTDHCKPPSRFGECPQSSVIRQGAKVNDLVVTERKASRPATRG